MSNQIDITPDPNLIFAICEQSSLTFRLCLGELIDNAFDADAPTVEIVFGPTLNRSCSYMRVSDNGNGCPDLASMLTLGRHARQRGTKLGRYGIGLKDAVLWIGKRDSNVTITSIHEGRERSVSVDWSKLVRSREWRVDAPLAVPAQPGTPSGTTILVSPVPRAVPHGDAWNDLLEELGYMYSPAIKRGRQIVLRKDKSRKGATEPGVPLERYRMPAMDEVLDRQISLFGKTARVYVGIVKDGANNKRPGLTYTHGFRVIKSACSDGCGDHAIAKISGFVELDDSWKLTKNKDDVSESKEELIALVYQEIRPLLIKADALNREHAEVNLAQELTDFFRAKFAGDSQEANAKAKREKGDATGTVGTTGRGIKHGRAAKEQLGKTFPSSTAGRRFSTMRVEFAPLGERGGIGRIEEGTTMRVLINTYGGLADAIQAGDRGILRVEVAALLAHRMTFEREQLHLRLWGAPDKIDGTDSERFSRNMAFLLSQSRPLVAKNAEAAA